MRNTLNICFGFTTETNILKNPKVNLVSDITYKPNFVEFRKQKNYVLECADFALIEPFQVLSDESFNTSDEFDDEFCAYKSHEKQAISIMETP